MFSSTSMEHIENLGIMMNLMILKFFMESNRTENLSEFSIDKFSIFREKMNCYSLKNTENILIENSDKFSALLLP